MTTRTKEKCLVFIYNADSGAINAIRDYFQKMLLPNTYECNLCAVTYGNLGMKQEWKKYVKELTKDISVEFLHRDEFEEYYPEIPEPKYPSAYYFKGKGHQLFISQLEMNSLETIEELEKLVNKKLKKID